MRVWMIGVMVGGLVSGCASTQTIPSQIEQIDQPALGAVAAIEVGEAAVATGRGRSLPGLALANELSWGDGVLRKRFTVAPGRLAARQSDARHIYYFSDRMTARDPLFGTAPYASGGLCRAKDGSGPVRGFITPGQCVLTWNATPQVRDIRIEEADEGARRRELIYHGRADGKVRFLYRETMGDSAPQTQSLDYDLAHSAVIGFRGARLEVLEADNTRLRYRLLAPFDGDD
ncbi:hypothetical protein [Brevundimonas naejangsanensis]|uniref:hypothetical protein n=1 Tax=Brevundimonas naejangsanensis TaxID=588932 RepID=UPI00106CA121|nr:hypothetical protein [Brevundimonas naejangsanensis]QBQ49649.1 hypothetical protein E3U41_13695 [Brevundimonas naejangsanensis]